MVNGDFFPEDRLDISEGDRVGVVLLNLGGPNSVEEIEPFLYSLFMDPAIIDIPVGGIFRHWLCSFIARSRSNKVAKDYALIGGGSPINRLTYDQASNLEKALDRFYGQTTDVAFKVYIAMRYWHPTTEETALRMKEDGVNKVVLLPLYPQYSKTTTGASLVYWWMLQEEGEIERCPTVAVNEYATHPKYVQAISDRIDQKLAAFPEETRSGVTLVFSAHGTPLYEMKRRKDPYCCLIHSTVEQVMNYRGDDLPYHVSFQSKVGPSEWLTPSTPDKLKELADAGRRLVLVIPIAFVTDHIETAFELDIEFREVAMGLGLQQYEVTDGLNSHPLFIEALAEAAVAKLRLPTNEATTSEAAEFYDYNALPRASSEERGCRCHQCEFITEAVQWTPTSVHPAAD